MKGQLAALWLPAALLAVLAAATLAFNDVLWERRRLNCTQGVNDPLPKCTLELRKEPTAHAAVCQPEMRAKRGSDELVDSYLCSVECQNATTDSVVFRVPSSRHKCSKGHTYGTEHRPNGQWYFWKIQPCTAENVSLSVWCKYSFDNYDKLKAYEDELKRLAQ